MDPRRHNEPKVKVARREAPALDLNVLLVGLLLVAAALVAVGM